MPTNPTDDLLSLIHHGSHMAVQGYDEVIKDTRDEEIRRTLMQMQNLHKEVALEASRRLQSAGAVPEEPHVLARVQVWANEGLRTLFDRSPETLLKVLLDGARMGLSGLEDAIDRDFHAQGDVVEFAYRYRDGQRRQLEKLRELRRTLH
ncbi:MAG TPA: hypothetical protein VD902_18705 [Symbiobacteriaceae bacterium]|nr:hypothetical protein [Symbiobacteriaceae bacterium]